MEIVVHPDGTRERVQRVGLLPGQRKFLREWRDHPVIFWCGALGCGKSWADGMFALEQSLRYPGNYGCVAAATFPQLRRATIRSVLGVFDQFSIPYRYNKNEQLVRLENGSEFIFVSTKVPKEELQGPEFGWLACDEAEGIPEEQFRALLGRVRRRGTPQLARITFNPPNRGHWIERRLVTEPIQGWSLMRSTTYENRKYLGSNYIANMERFYRPPSRENPHGSLQWRRYLNGEMGLAMEGVVYPEFEISEHTIEAREWEAARRRAAVSGYVCGLDFGWNHPTAYVQLALIHEWDPICARDDGTTADGMVVVCGEYYNNRDTIANHAERIHAIHRGGVIYSDHQRQEREEYDRLGVPTEPAPKLGDGHGRLEGIEAVRQRFQAGTLKIVRQNCPNLIRELGLYRWAAPKSDDVEFREDVVKLNDDACDALRYAVTGLDRAGAIDSIDMAHIFGNWSE